MDQEVHPAMDAAILHKQVIEMRVMMMRDVSL